MNKNDSEVDIDQLIRDYDETFMPLPDIECEPHLLISKVSILPIFILCAYSLPPYVFT